MEEFGAAFCYHKTGEGKDVDTERKTSENARI